MLIWSCFAVAVTEVLWRVVSAYRVGDLYSTFAIETISSAVLCGSGLGLLLWYYPLKFPAFILRPFVGVIAIAGILLLAQLPDRSQSLWGLPAAVPFASIIVLQAMTYEWRVLDTAIGRFLGRISYGIYLWGFVAAAVVRWLGYSMKHTLVFLVAICFATLSHYVVERPIQSLTRRWLMTTGKRTTVVVGGPI